MVGPTVLLAEPDVQTQAVLGGHLAAAGFVVRGVRGGDEALSVVRSAARGAVDVIVTEVTLPGMSDYGLLRQLRAEGSTIPVLVVSGKYGDYDRVTGLDLGAHAYLPKPVSPVLVIAHLQAMLRRAAGAYTRTNRLCRVGDLILDVDATHLRVGSRSVRLSHRETALMETFANQPTRVWTRTELLDNVWFRASPPTINVVEVYVGYLRRKMAQVGAGELLRTVRGRGYQLAANPHPHLKS